MASCVCTHRFALSGLGLFLCLRQIKVNKKRRKTAPDIAPRRLRPRFFLFLSPSGGGRGCGVLPSRRLRVSTASSPHPLPRQRRHADAAFPPPPPSLACLSCSLPLSLRCSLPLPRFSRSPSRSPKQAEHHSSITITPPLATFTVHEAPLLNPLHP